MKLYLCTLVVALTGCALPPQTPEMKARFDATMARIRHDNEVHAQRQHELQLVQARNPWPAPVRVQRVRTTCMVAGNMVYCN